MTESRSDYLSELAEYRKLRLSLVRSFQASGLADAENLADEVVRRVLSSIESGTVIQSLPIYAKAVARNVRKEEVRRLKQEREVAASLNVLSRAPSSSSQIEECLAECLAKLDKEDQSLLQAYYNADGRARIDQHRALAESLHINSDALTMRVHRLRRKLLQCVAECGNREQ